MTSPITRHRHELRRRVLSVRETIALSPGMIRILFGGPELDGFLSLAPDDHVKLFVPGPDGTPTGRDYTPRRYDLVAGTLAVDFAVHDAGPATRWAIDARPGDTLTIGGPRGSAVVSAPVDWWLLIGDETALPAIGRRIEELAADTRVTSLVAVADAAEHQRFDTPARHEAHWVHRPLTAADDPTALLQALRDLDVPPGTGFVWIAAEARVARALRDHVVQDRGHPQSWTKAAGYWLKGSADVHETLE